MSYNDILQKTVEVWCPNYPRRCSGKAHNNRGWGQVSAYSDIQLIDYINEIRGVSPGYVSVYSFPEGHTSEDGENIPLIDTLMFDLDFEGEKDASKADWARDMSALLVRTRMIAKSLIESGRSKYWRASLSGHKGIHLYLDFPAIDRREGTAYQFRNGVRNYTENFIEAIKDETGLSNLDEYIDVVSGKDFARLTRLPNTVHDGASERFGETRFCVPVSIEELAEITTTEYINMTRRPRKVPEACRRVPNQRVHDILVKEIRMSNDSSVLTGNYSSANYDTSRVEHYENEVANDAVTVERLKIYLRDCCWKFHERDDRFAHGHQSHIMELNCIAEMIDCNAPIDTMVEFFSVDDHFDESYTRSKIRDVISYGYRPMANATLLTEAQEFLK